MIGQQQMAEVITQELPFEVEPAPEPEPAPKPEPVVATEPSLAENPRMVSSAIEKLKDWLNRLAE